MDRYHIRHDIEGEAAILHAPNGTPLGEIIKSITVDRNIVVTPVFIPKGCREVSNLKYPIVLGALQSSSNELISYSVHYTDQIVINFHLDDIRKGDMDPADVIPGEFDIPVETILSHHQLTTDRVSQCVAVWINGPFGVDREVNLWMGSTSEKAVHLLPGANKICATLMGVTMKPHCFKREFGFVKANLYKRVELL